MIETASTSFWSFIQSLTDAYITLINFHDSNPFAFNVFALTIAIPLFSLALVQNLLWFFRCKKLMNQLEE